MVVTDQSLTHAAPRITEYQFASALLARPAATTQWSYTMWQDLISNGIDPSFALAHFWVESLLGTAGYAKTTHSWGNILWGNGNPAIQAVSTMYSPGNGFHYVNYKDWLIGMQDYCWLVDKDASIGMDTIYDITHYWTGKAAGSASHLKYLQIVMDRIAMYDAWGGTHGENLMMCDDFQPTSNQHIILKQNTNIYAYPTATKVWYVYPNADTTVQWFGYHPGTTAGRILITSSKPYGDHVMRRTMAYVQNVKASDILGPSVISTTSRKTYKIPLGTPIYTQPGDATPEFKWDYKNSGPAHVFGRVMGSSWIANAMISSRGQPDGKARWRMIFIPNVQDSQLVSV